MKTTSYFRARSQYPDRNWIRPEWIEMTVSKPTWSEVQLDGRIRRWRIIPEANNRVLRVVVLEDGETVHNAFFDRSFTLPNA
jgi:hypothetical protein